MIRRIKVELDLDVEVDETEVSDKILEFLIHDYLAKGTLEMCDTHGLEHGGVITSVSVED